MPSKDGTMDDNKKSTKDVVNKKQKQMMNQEEYLPEEEYDRYRDRIAMAGGDHRSKETRERSNTPTGKQPKGKTVYQKQAEKKYGKGKSALDMVKADITAKYGKGAIMDVKKKEKKKKDVKEGAGLYANIHAKRKRGGKMRKKGDKGAPSSQDFANAAKTAREELDLTQVAEAFGGQIIETKTFTEKSFVEFRHQLNEINERNPFSIDKILGAGLSSANFIKKQFQKIPYRIDPKKAQKLFDKFFKNINKNKNPIKKKIVKVDKPDVNKKIDPKEIKKKLKIIKKDNNKVDTNVDSQSNVTDNPLKDVLKKVDNKTLQKIGGVGAGSVVIGIGVDQLNKNKNKPSTETELVPNQIKNNKKTVVTTKDDKKKKSKFTLPGVPRLDTGTIGQRTAG